MRAQALNKNMKVQTYQFNEGQNFKEISREKGTFNDIVIDLARHLVKQNFYPKPVPGEGDILVAVHYETTIEHENQINLWGFTGLEDFGFTEGIESIGRTGTTLSPGEINAIQNIHSNLSMQQAINFFNGMTRFEKAKLLGLDDLWYRRLHPPHNNYEYETILQQDLYFIVLMAYDFEHFLRMGEAKLLWSTRYRVRSPGQSFENAFRGMNNVASDFFGKNIDEISRKRLEDDSSFEIGELEVIEEPEIDGMN